LHGKIETLQPIPKGTFALRRQVLSDGKFHGRLEIIIYDSFQSVDPDERRLIAVGCLAPAPVGYSWCNHAGLPQIAQIRRKI
jgi:hypothetical protein